MENFEVSHWIRDIEPFNELFYKSCFSNAIFPVLSHYGADFGCILYNDLPLYRFNGNKEMHVEYYSVLPIEQVVTDVGLTVETKQISEEIITDIIALIANNQPVVISVDCYYVPVRKSMFLKRHWPHYLLVIGYDQEAECFSVFEHQSVDALNYEKLDIGFADIKHSYEGYLSNFRVKNEITFYSFASGNLDLMRKQQGMESYAMNVMSHWSYITESHKQLETYISELISILSDEMILRDNLPDIVNGLNEIINAIKAEEFKMSLAFTAEREHTLSSLITRIKESWMLIRGRIVKFQFTGKYDPKSVENSIEALESIIGLEYRYYYGIKNIFGS